MLCQPSEHYRGSFHPSGRLANDDDRNDFACRVFWLRVGRECYAYFSGDVGPVCFWFHVASRFGIVRHRTVQRCAVQHRPVLSMYRATAKLFVFRIRTIQAAQIVASFGQEREFDFRFRSGLRASSTTRTRLRRRVPRFLEKSFCALEWIQFRFASGLQTICVASFREIRGHRGRWGVPTHPQCVSVCSVLTEMS